MKYTFKALDEEGITWYPLQYKWEDPQCPSPVGMLDFYWTKDIKFARTWPEKEMAEAIAMEFCNSEVIEVEE